jgi:aquaporin NIP
MKLINVYNYIHNDMMLISSLSSFQFLFLQVIAEVIGTYFLVFAGCGSGVVNKIYGSVSFPGICIVWGLILMVMIYSVGHISGAHFNPAVTITFAIFRRFPLKQAG